MEKVIEADNGEVTDDTVTNKEHEKVWEEILDFVMWEFIIEVHRATKLNYLHLDPDLDPNWDENSKKRREAAKNVPGQEKPDNVVCPNCQSVFGSMKFGRHLTECLGGGRKAALQKKVQDSRCDTKDNTSKRTSQRIRGQKKSNACGNSSKSSGEDNDIFKNMTYEEINQFLVEKCGVLTRSKRRCINLFKCAQHTHEAKQLVRQTYSKNPGDDASNDQMVDQHAVKGNLGFVFP